MSEPRTEAGKVLLDTLNRGLKLFPGDRERAILAIEAEASQPALSVEAVIAAAERASRQYGATDGRKVPEMEVLALALHRYRAALSEQL